MRKKWWKEAVVYQIYPRSFMDSDGDGIGDLQGIISKLDYLKELGIDCLWICPIYASPNDDNGYDISNYQGIMDEFGTMADFDQLLKEVHDRGMKLIMDLVINHTSDEHPWFIESRSSKNNPYRNYYIWKEGKKGQDPNNWESIFGGSVWEFDSHTNEYYMHVFSRRQPDLNWENPNVRKELYEMIHWWLRKGIDGFRVDAISHIKKIPGLPDLPNPKRLKYVPSFKGHMNREGIQVFLKELRTETFSQYDIMTVGEANGVKVEDAKNWVGEENGAFNMVFQFEHLDLWGKSESGGLDIHALKETLTKWQKGLEGIGWNALFLENHDQPRSISTWGSEEYWNESAKCLATLYFLMQGTPFIYQGQEIGMTNVQFPTMDDYRDVAIKNLYKEEKEKGKTHQEIMEIIWKNGRDNARTPMQWVNHKNGGFTKGTPWIKVNSNYQRINVNEQIQNPLSIYHYYRKLIQLRKKYPALIYGNYDLLLADSDHMFVYTRTLGNEKFLIMTNLFNVNAICSFPEEWNNHERTLMIHNYEVEQNEDLERITFKPYEARVYRLDDKSMYH